MTLPISLTQPHPAAANENRQPTARPSADEAMEAVRTLIRWAGDNPSREGLVETPKRVIEAYREFYAGYEEDPDSVLAKTFDEVAGYDEVVLLKNMQFESHCEHHMVPIIGRAHIAYLPDKKVVGLSKIARLLDVFAHRLQTQELMTQQIADTIERVLAPRGVAVIIDANHECMSTRGVHKTNSTTVTTQMRGIYKTDKDARAEVMRLIASADIG
ncbi:MAG: GTP cyclohydrolase I FolE [Rickettsiales bacterium]